MIERHWKDADNFLAVTAGRGLLASTNKAGKMEGDPNHAYILRNSAFYFHAGKT
jgi:hypothetical protein